ncbi:response regulator [Lacinutrix sp. Hel_I_90]|uniref:response regulator n=1 Tax=Lacinutrix sp. Hel_I_90 TaxID=1249999 RepID=UPI0005C8E75A|nr:response regulator [Lacinutrix sp. Hel_I_90]
MKPKKVLIVHDDYGISYLLKKILERPDVTYEVANTYMDVEQLLLETIFDLVITDVTIQGAFTNDYLQFLKNKLQNVFIIIVSEMNQIEIKKEVELLGIDTFIDLPIAVNELKNKVNAFF